jgi:hypothetical protein
MEKKHEYYMPLGAHDFRGRAGETATQEGIRHKNTVLKTTRRQFQVFVNTRVNY